MKKTVDGDERVGEKGFRLPHLYIKLSIHVRSATETATERSDFLVTTAVDDVTYGACP